MHLLKITNRSCAGDIVKSSIVTPSSGRSQVVLSVPPITDGIRRHRMPWPCKSWAKTPPESSHTLFGKFKGKLSILDHLRDAHRPSCSSSSLSRSKGLGRVCSCGLSSFCDRKRTSRYCRSVDLLTMSVRCLQTYVMYIIILKEGFMTDDTCWHLTSAASSAFNKHSGFLSVILG